MFCQFCGAVISEDDRFCNSCGKAKQNNGNINENQSMRNMIGFSSRINDPKFKKYIKDSNSWSAIFTIILAVIAVVGFTIAGEFHLDNLDNPESMYIGFGVGSMFIVIALFQIIGRKRSFTWDGTVVDKTIKEKTSRSSDEDNTYEEYLLYEVIIRSEDGKKHIISAKDDDTLYNYYKIGDKIRHHGGINSYEKYDKSQDSIIFCSACGTLCDINDDQCFRCKCPLLK